MYVCMSVCMHVNYLGFNHGLGLLNQKNVGKRDELGT